MKQIVLIVHDIRSCHNVGSLLRTAEGLGVAMVYFTGYTPYPSLDKDSRLPHIHKKLTQQIHKTALGAESHQPWQPVQDVTELISQLKDAGYRIVALEQSGRSVDLASYESTEKTALLIGREVEGIDKALLAIADDIVVIPMFGQKESFNVVQATAMALYQLRFL